MAPAIATHEAPDALQRCHWYVNVIGASPVHVPLLAVSAWPLCGVVSEIVGGAVFVGPVLGLGGRDRRRQIPDHGGRRECDERCEQHRPGRLSGMRANCVRGVSHQIPPRVACSSADARSRARRRVRSQKPYSATLGLVTSFSLRRLRLRSGEQFRDGVEIELEPFEFGGQRYLPVPERVPAELTVTQASTGTVFELRFTARIHGPCMRCLADAVVDRDVSAREYQATKPDSEDLASPYVRDDQLDPPPGRATRSRWGCRRRSSAVRTARASVPSAGRI